MNRTSLVVQWLGICLPILGSWIQSLVREDPTCHGTTKPVRHNLPDLCSRACAPQQGKPPQGEARAPQQRVAPLAKSREEPEHSNEDPAQPIHK